jgi:hypothetical protein
MLNMIQLNYYMNGEELRPRFLKAYHETDNVIKLDCIQDALYYLELEYERVSKETYPRPKNSKYVSKYEAKLTPSEHEALQRYDDIRQRVAEIVYQEEKNGTAK